MFRSPWPPPSGSLTKWDVCILTLACVIGTAAGILTYLVSPSFPQALLASGTAAGGTMRLLHQIVGVRRGRRPAPKGQDDDPREARQPNA